MNMNREPLVDLSAILSTATEGPPGLWTATVDSASVSYPETGHRSLAAVEENSYWFRHRATVLSEVLQNHPPKGCVFDVGGGNGFMVRAMRNHGFESILIEPGRDGCQTAQTRGLSPILNGTTEELGVVEGSLPSVGLFDVVEHVEFDEAFLGHIASLMCDDGLLYLTVPAYQALWSANDVSAGHFRRYSRNEISALVENAGLNIVYSTYLFGSLTFPIWLLRAMPHRLGLKASRANTTDVHTLPSGVVGRFIERSLSREVATVSDGRSVRWGTSVLIVAEKHR